LPVFRQVQLLHKLSRLLLPRLSSRFAQCHKPLLREGADLCLGKGGNFYISETSNLEFLGSGATG
jgi:hypothetical protein